MDTITLILIFSVLLFLGVRLVTLSKPTAQEKIYLNNEEDNFEIAEEIFPLVTFPPEVEQELIPDLPSGYNETGLTIMARDPEWVYAYWDLNEDQINWLRRTYVHLWDNSKSVLRVYDVTGVVHFEGCNANSYFDIPVDENAGSWYFCTGRPNNDFCVDLGRLFVDGTFVTIARSNKTSTPRNTVSDKIDHDWAMVSEDEMKLLKRIGLNEHISSYDLFEDTPN